MAIIVKHKFPASITLRFRAGTELFAKKSFFWKEKPYFFWPSLYKDPAPHRSTQRESIIFLGGGGDNWAKKHGKWHRTTVCEQLLPETGKAQSVTPQTTKYRYRTVISDQWIHWKFEKKSGPQRHYFCQFSHILTKIMSLWPDFFPISIFSGLGGHGLNFFGFGQ